MNVFKRYWREFFVLLLLGLALLPFFLKLVAVFEARKIKTGFCKDRPAYSSKAELKRAILEKLILNVRLLDELGSRNSSWIGPMLKEGSSANNDKTGYFSRMRAYKSVAEFLEANPECCEMPAKNEGTLIPTNSERAAGWTTSIEIVFRDRVLRKSGKVYVNERVTSGRTFLVSDCGLLELARFPWNHD